MSSPGTMDFDELLAPVSAENAVGDDLRKDTSPTSPYYTIKLHRDTARAQERSDALEEASPRLEDWLAVAKIGREIIAKQSKDLEILALLTEAMVRLEGFAGLRDSFRLTRQLVELFWDDLYPLPDEDGLERKLAPLSGLNGQDNEGTLIVPIRKIALTEPGESRPYAQWQYQKAVGTQGKANAGEQKRGSEFLDAMEKTAAQTDLAFFEFLRDDLRECQDEFGQLCAALDERCGSQAPPSSNIRNALRDCVDALHFLAGNRLPEEVAADDEEADEGEESSGTSAAPAARTGETGQLANRDEAFAALVQLAAYFRRTEPHSPISYSLEQAVRWGRMPLPELLQELIADEHARGDLFKITGIRPPSD